ncbi:MAG: ABC transporter substrate-binding protein [Cellulomonadaceae bacterium]
MTIEFFQGKSEAIATYNDIIADFEAQNPDIHVVQNNVPDALAVLRSRLVKNDAPDVIAINGDQNFRALTEAGIFDDYTGSPALEELNPAAVEALTSLAQYEDEINGVPLILNAQVLLYRTDLFEQAGLEVPTTWDEVLAVSEQIKARGETPFEFTFMDAWTAQSVWNTITPQTLPEDFWDELREGKESISPAMDEAATKMVQLLDYANADPFGTDYDRGNTAMANGQAYMYIQGIWAIPAIRGVNPDTPLGATVIQWTDDPDRTAMVSGIDQVLTTVKGGEHPEEAQRFIEFLTSQDSQQKLSDGLMVFSVRSDVEPSEDLLADLKPWLDDGRIVGFPEHQLLSGVNLGAALQEFLYARDPEQLGTDLQKQWDSAAEREIR